MEEVNVSTCACTRSMRISHRAHDLSSKPRSTRRQNSVQASASTETSSRSKSYRWSRSARCQRASGSEATRISWGSTAASMSCSKKVMATNHHSNSVAQQILWKAMRARAKSLAIWPNYSAGVLRVAKKPPRKAGTLSQRERRQRLKNLKARTSNL